jgi:hypothetical protein
MKKIFYIEMHVVDFSKNFEVRVLSELQAIVKKTYYKPIDVKFIKSGFYSEFNDKKFYIFEGYAEQFIDLTELVELFSIKNWLYNRIPKIFRELGVETGYAIWDKRDNLNEIFIDENIIWVYITI